MKRLILIIAILLSLPLGAQAQSVFAVGAQGGTSFGNYFVGVTGLGLVPVTRHTELDVQDIFSPVERHVALGNGWANQATVGGIVWVRHNLGIDGSATRSNYSVTSVSKAQTFGHGGLTVRTASLGVPARFTFDYLRELHDGVVDGVESSHLQGGSFGLLTRMGCRGNACVMLEFTYQVGHLLTQGNPVCDGSYSGANTCPRAGAWAGAFTGGLYVAFPRPRGHEDDAF